MQKTNRSSKLSRHKAVLSSQQNQRKSNMVLHLVHRFRSAESAVFNICPDALGPCQRLSVWWERPTPVSWISRTRPSTIIATMALLCVYFSIAMLGVIHDPKDHISTSWIFVNYKDECQHFCLDEGRLKDENETYLTSNALQVLSFNVVLSGERQSPIDNLQPRLTVFLEIQGKEQSWINIQTTISQRNPDVRK